MLLNKKTLKLQLVISSSEKPKVHQKPNLKNPINSLTGEKLFWQRNITQWEDQHEGLINAGSTLAADRCSEYWDTCSNVRRSLGWHSILECNPTPFHTTHCHA
jgi:hypothetical protein